jgi:hypothetical protein
MQVRHLVEKEDGTAVFQGVLNERELQFVVEIGLETLIREGMVPFTSTNEVRNIFDIHEEPDQEQ